MAACCASYDDDVRSSGFSCGYDAGESLRSGPEYEDGASERGFAEGCCPADAVSEHCAGQQRDFWFEIGRRLVEIGEGADVEAFGHATPEPWRLIHRDWAAVPSALNAEAIVAAAAVAAVVAADRELEHNSVTYLNAVMLCAAGTDLIDNTCDLVTDDGGIGSWDLAGEQSDIGSADAARLNAYEEIVACEGAGSDVFDAEVAWAVEHCGLYGLGHRKLSS
jgi:hypothetical protein